MQDESELTYGEYLEAKKKAEKKKDLKNKKTKSDK